MWWKNDGESEKVKETAALRSEMLPGLRPCVQETLVTFDLWHVSHTEPGVGGHGASV